MSVIRTALVGCGSVADAHLDAIDAHGDDFDLVGVCDPDADAREAAAERTDAPAFEEMDELLEATSPDLMVVASPSGHHADQVARAADAGSHVLCEKPLALSADAARRAAEQCRHAGVELRVVRQLRALPTVRRVRRAVGEGRFGSVTAVDADIFWTRPQSYYDADGWRGTADLDGGVFVNQTLHYLDLLTWIFGPVADLQATAGILERDIEVPDTGAVNLEFASGAVGSVTATLVTHPENFTTSLTATGADGTVRLTGNGWTNVDHWQFADGGDHEEGIERAQDRAAELRRAGHTAVYDQLRRRLLADMPPPADDFRPAAAPENALNSLELAVEAERTSR